MINPTSDQWRSAVIEWQDACLILEASSINDSKQVFEAKRDAVAHADKKLRDMANWPASSMIRGEGE